MRSSAPLCVHGVSTPPCETNTEASIHEFGHSLSSLFTLLLNIMLSYTFFWNTSWVDLVKNLSLNIQTAVTEVLLLKITNRKYSFTQCIKTLKHSLCFWTSLMGASCIQAQAILKKLLTYKNSANQLVFELIMLCVIVQGLDVHQWHMEHQRRLDLFELIETDHLFISISILGAEVTTAHSST